MFTGIVEKSVSLLASEVMPFGRRLVIENIWGDLRHGESIAVNGTCLTVAGFDANTIAFDVISESLNKTNLGDLAAGDLVHVERAMRIGDRFDGHFVQGHIDGTGVISQQRQDVADWRTRLDVPVELMRYMIPKGSVALDGISLTIAAMGECWIEVALIPTTLDITQLGRKAVGSRVNIECDLTVKTIVNVMDRVKISK